MKMLYSILLCAILSAVAVQAQKQRVLLEHMFLSSSATSPEVLMYIDDLVEEYGEENVLRFNYNARWNASRHAAMMFGHAASVGADRDFSYTMVNRRTDHNPYGGLKGIHRSGLRQQIEAILDEEPILEIIPTGTYIVLSGPFNRSRVEFTVIWHKPETDVRIEIAWLQDSISMPQRNPYDTVSGHLLYGKGDPIEDFYVRYHVLAGETQSCEEIALYNPERLISYTGQDTVYMNVDMIFQGGQGSPINIREELRLFKMLIVAVKCGEEDIFGGRLYTPILNAAVIHGRDMTLADMTSVSEEAARVEERAPLRVYPNPANTWLTVEHQAALEGGELEVIDMMGRTVVASPTGSGSTSKLRVSHLPEGMYTVLLRHQGSVQAGKVMVRK